MEDKKQPIIVKRINKGAHGHHGGSWKVAFADFATAMMAFFMLLWLLGSVPQEKLAGVSEFFENVSLTEGIATVPAPGMNGPGGASTSMIDLGGSQNITKGEGEKINQQHQEKPGEAHETMIDEKQSQQENAERIEKEQLDSLMQDLKKAMNKSQALEPFKDQLKLDITPEGLRIQILDKENRSMFESGKASLKGHMIDILHEVAGFINGVPNRISISGHTDAIPFAGREDYSNWELSSDRANAARRTLIEGGLAEDKLGRVVGLASSTLFDRAHPESAVNRRISIIVMNKRTEQAMTEGEGGDLNSLPENVKQAPLKVDDGTLTAINRPSMLEIRPDAERQETSAPANKAGNDLNDALHDLQSLNAPQEAQKAQNARPAQQQPPRSLAPPAPLIQLPPIIDPSQLPRGR
jgi:chemotaxis protein MotB